MVSKKSDELFSNLLMRFCITGVFNTALHGLIAVTCIELLYLHPAIANGIAFICATTASYTINTQWTFSTQITNKTFVKFALVSLFGLIATVTIAWLAENYRLNHYLGIFLTILLVTPLTFALHQWWTYQ